MNNLTKFRTKHNLTQQDLADLCGMTKANVSFVENNKMSRTNAERFASVLNENIFDIMGQDVFNAIPKTKEDFKFLRKIIDDLEERSCLTKKE